MDSFTIVSEHKYNTFIPNVHPMYFIFVSLLFLSLYCCLKYRNPNIRQRQRSRSNSMV